MKWYFALNSSTIYRYYDHIRAAVNSAIQNTTLSPHFIYDGEPDQLTSWLESKGVTIIYHKSSFIDKINQAKESHGYDAETASGAFLRVDIPTLNQEDDYVLYTDCDVIFLSDPTFSDCYPKYFACAPESDRDNYSTDAGNTGVMLMNLKNLRKVHPYFIDFIGENILHFSAYDQGAYKTFFHNNWGKLDLIYNWKPYWGFNTDAKIVHFHGPKYFFLKKMLEENSCGNAHWSVLILFHQSEEDYKRYYALLTKYNYE